MDVEPYVADPEEHPPAARWEGLRPLIWTLVVLLLTAAVLYLAFGDRSAQDPAMGAPRTPVTHLV